MDTSTQAAAKDIGAIDLRLATLRNVIAHHESLAVAISGGVDSTTLATVAHEVLGQQQVLMIHATSPAVPSEATMRVKRYASKFGWNLRLIDAREFSDAQYQQNPVNRCYFCKSNLYHRIREVWQGNVASGANLDDLGDYRPGLLAASESAVIHPLIEAEIDKSGVRVIASKIGLDAVADLPAQPCLSSRIETGIPINADDLMFVHSIEKMLVRHLGQGNVRCRITAQGVRIEVDDALRTKAPECWSQAQADVESLISQSGRVFAGYATYQRGSAFLIHELQSGDALHER